jgi:hypothetical protein
LERNVRTEIPKLITKKLSINYSSGSIARAQNLAFLNGVCVPASCSSQKAVEFVNRRFLIEADLFGLSAQCQTGNAKPFKFLDYFAMYDELKLLNICVIHRLSLQSCFFYLRIASSSQHSLRRFDNEKR